MDAKDLRTETTLGERNNDGSNKFAQSVAALSCNSNKTFDTMPSNPLAKTETPTSRPCAVIGPDRIIPPPSTADTYLKKGHYEPWPTMDNTYPQLPEYPIKMPSYLSPIGNISPRQTFQENMQRIMVQPTYNSKVNEDASYAVDRNLSKINKINGHVEPKYCDVPYSMNPMTNDQKSGEMCVPNVNNPRNYPQMWHPAGVNMRPARSYGAPELYQYPEYASCAAPRPVPMTRPHRTITEDPGHIYSDTYYHDGNIRFKPYPNVKERFPQSRYEYISNYTNPFHPFPPYKYDMQKPLPPHPTHSQIPIKYVDNRMPESVLEGYQRPPQGPYAAPYRNQIVHPTYGPILGNNLPNKLYPYPTEGPVPVKPVASNKLPYDNKMYIDFDTARNKGYPMHDNFYEMRPHMKNQVIMPNYPTANVPHPHPYYRKENVGSKNFEYISHLRHLDPSLNPNTLTKMTSQFSPTAIAISPSDSNTSNDTSHTQGGSLEDCGYVSQSSTASIRSVDSGVNRMMPNDFHRRYNYAYPPTVRTSPLTFKPETNSNTSSKNKKGIDVRQFLQMWNEGDEESSKEASKPDYNITNKPTSQYEAAKNHEQLYILGSMPVPSEELGKYEHIQKVSKLPENIKGYNNIELLKHFEEAIESSNLSISNQKQSLSRNYHSSSKSSLMQALPPRPLSPLDVEAKISQSVIHKEVGCNFEIRPCSPEMLNVEIATPAQTILNERTIEKVSNPILIEPLSMVNSNGNDSLCTIMKPNDHTLISNENNKIASCKMISTQCSNNDTTNVVKANYTLQDLESNAGVCLASLPRLDNDIELNFPEVNQQFINANKESVITTTDFDTKPDNFKAEGTAGDLEIASKILPASELDKDLSKLSKYRKIKRNNVICQEKPLEINSQSLRTDSVIIKNPENTKVMEYISDIQYNDNESRQEIKDNERSKEVPIDSTGSQDVEQNFSNEIAIDFSVHKIDNHKLNDCLASEHVTTTDTKDVQRLSDRKLLENTESICEITLNTKELNTTTPTLEKNIKSTQNSPANDKEEHQLEINIDSTRNSPAIDKEEREIEINNLQHNLKNIDHTTSCEREIKITKETIMLVTENNDDDTKNGIINSVIGCETENTSNGESNQQTPEIKTKSLNVVSSKMHKYETIPSSILPSEQQNDSNILITENKNDINSETMCESESMSNEEVCMNVDKSGVNFQNVTFSNNNENSDKLLPNSKQNNYTHVNQTNKDLKILLNNTDKNIIKDRWKSIASSSCKTINSEWPKSTFETGIQSQNEKSLKFLNVCKNVTHTENNTNFSLGIDSPSMDLDTNCEQKYNNTSPFVETHANINLKSPKGDNQNITDSFIDSDDISLSIDNKCKDTKNISINGNGTLKALDVCRDVTSIEYDSHNSSDVDVNCKVNHSTKIKCDETVSLKPLDKCGSETFKESVLITTKDADNISFDIDQDSKNIGKNLNLCSDNNKKIEPECHTHSSMENDSMMVEITHNLKENASDSHLYKENKYDLTLAHCEINVHKLNQHHVKNSDKNTDIAESTENAIKFTECGVNIVNCSFKKELYSPWIQKLILKNEGKCTYSLKSQYNSEFCYEKSKIITNGPFINIFNKNQSKEESVITINNQELNCLDVTQDKILLPSDVSINVVAPNSQYVIPPGPINDMSYLEDASYSTNRLKNVNMKHENVLPSKLIEENPCMDNISTANGILFNPDVNRKTEINKESIINSENVFNEETKLYASNLSHTKSPNSVLTDTPGEQNTNSVYSNDISCNDYDNENKSLDISYVSKNNVAIVLDSGIYDIESSIFENTKEQIDGSTTSLHVSCNIDYEEDSIEKSLSKIHSDKTIDKKVEDNNTFLRRHLKRSLSESALDMYIDDIHETRSQEDLEQGVSSWAKKPRRNKAFLNECGPRLTANDVLNIQNNRRNSISSVYNDENMSLCILIDNNCIITEENEEEKVCYNLTEECLATIHEDSINESNIAPNSEIILCPQEDTGQYTETLILDFSDEKPFEESWVDDVACVETVVSDDIAEDIEINAPSSPSDIESDNDESNIFNNFSEHTEKVKYIYGDKMCTDDADLVETLYRTPQMDVNKTLVNRECHTSDDSDDSRSNAAEISFSESNKTSFVEPEVDGCLKNNVPDTYNETVSNAEYNSFDVVSNEIQLLDLPMSPCAKESEETKKNNHLYNSPREMTQHTDLCESSIDEVLSSKQEEHSNNGTGFSSPEVSSTTTEEKNSTILLKITNYKGTRISHLSDINSTNSKSNSCRFTENVNYANYQSNSTIPRPLITKAAQKYIPPSKEMVVGDLKVKLPLPQQSLMKFKQMKISKKERPSNSVKDIKKKPKPKFEDVLKSIDEIQFRMHKEKTKKPKKPVPKVVIKKNENGSHYASTPIGETFNPDLTGRKWQPWVFIEKDNFIDKMAIRNQMKAIFNHRKNTYVFADKFKKYKSIPSTKFVISQHSPPNSNDTGTGQFKYTIRLKHNY